MNTTTEDLIEIWDGIKKNDKSKLDYSAVFSVLLAITITVSYLGNIFYYSYFGIHILEYEQLNDIFILIGKSFSTLFIYIVGFIITTYILTKFNNDIIEVDERKRKYSFIAYIRNPTEFRINKLLKFTMIFSIILLAVWALDYWTFKPFSFHFTFIFIAYVCFSFFCVWKFNNMINYLTKRHDNLYYAIALYFILFSSYTIMSVGYTLYCNTDKNYISNQYTFRINNKDTIANATSDLVYIGKTSNYLFLFNTKNQQPIIYPRSIIEYEKIDLIEKYRFFNTDTISTPLPKIQPQKEKVNTPYKSNDPPILKSTKII